MASDPLDPHVGGMRGKCPQVGQIARQHRAAGLRDRDDNRIGSGPTPGLLTQGGRSSSQRNGNVRYHVACLQQSIRHGISVWPIKVSTSTTDGTIGGQSRSRRRAPIRAAARGERSASRLTPPESSTSTSDSLPRRSPTGGKRLGRHDAEYDTVRVDHGAHVRRLVPVAGQ